MRGSRTFAFVSVRAEAGVLSRTPRSFRQTQVQHPTSNLHPSIAFSLLFSLSLSLSLSLSPAGASGIPLVPFPSPDRARGRPWGCRKPRGGDPGAAAGVQHPREGAGGSGGGYRGAGRPGERRGGRRTTAGGEKNAPAKEGRAGGKGGEERGGGMERSFWLRNAVLRGRGLAAVFLLLPQRGTGCCASFAFCTA